MVRTPLAPRSAFLVGIGAFLIWAAHLLAIYGAGGLLCARGGAGDPERLFAIGATLVALIAAGVMLVRLILPAQRGAGEGRFARDLAAASCVLAMIAVLWQALPAILIPACT